MFKDFYDIFEDEKHGIYQIRCKDDVITVEFTDADKEKIFQILVEHRNSTPEFGDIVNRLCEEFDRTKVFEVIQELEDLFILEKDSLKENYTEHLKEQIEFWQHGECALTLSANETQEKIENTKLFLFGCELMIDLLHHKAIESGIIHIEKMDISEAEQIRKIEFCIEDSDFLIIDADRWNPALLDHINETALKFNKPWILTRGINMTTASVGPLFVGRETGCYNCLMSRLKSNMEFLPYFQEYEKSLRKNYSFSSTQGGPIVLYDMLASICTVEMLKYITCWTVPAIYKAFLTIDFYAYEIRTHQLLKSPGCPVCSPSIAFNPAPWLEPLTLK